MENVSLQTHVNAIMVTMAWIASIQVVLASTLPIRKCVQLMDLVISPTNVTVRMGGSVEIVASLDVMVYGAQIHLFVPDMDSAMNRMCVYVVKDVWVSIAN